LKATDWGSFPRSLLQKLRWQDYRIAKGRWSKNPDFCGASKKPVAIGWERAHSEIA